MGWTVLEKFATPSGEICSGRETGADSFDFPDNWPKEKMNKLVL